MVFFLGNLSGSALMICFFMIYIADYQKKAVKTVCSTENSQLSEYENCVKNTKFEHLTYIRKEVK